MSGVAAPAFLAPANFVRSPEMAVKVWSAEEGRAYTRWLATNHYENFHVVSFLLPKRLHQDFYNVYAYCRWADDLADEIGDAAESLRLSNGGGANSRECTRGARPIPYSPHSRRRWNATAFPSSPSAT